MKPILMNTAMVKAILLGNKTVTRRLVKPQPRMVYYDGRLQDSGEDMKDGRQLYVLIAENQNGALEQIVPPYQPGDVLYVRETFTTSRRGNLFYRADYNDNDMVIDNPAVICFPAKEIKWRSSIHMPKSAARIFLQVTDVRVERLQDIMERGPRGAEREGFVNDIDLLNGGGASATKHFADCWNRTIKKADLDKYGWEANPWVWVIEFERISREEALKNDL